MPGASRREMEVAGELVAASRARTTRLAYGRHVKAWLEWAEEHQACPLPADPQDLQLFLVDRAVDTAATTVDAASGRVQVHGRLVMGSVQQLMAALSRLHSLAGFTPPTEHPRVKELMAGFGRTLERRPKGAKAALTWDLLNEVLDAQAVGAGTLSGLRARAVCELSDATGATAGQMARLGRGSVMVGEDTVEVVLPPSRRGGPSIRHVLGRDTGAAAAVMRWLSVVVELPGTALFCTREGKALTRQGLHKILAAQRVDGLAVGERVVSAADVRDRALLLGGWITALRRSSLSALTWDELRRTTAGWSVYVRRSKTDQEGRGVTVSVPSAPEGAAIADPAGAIDDWLEVVTAILGVDPRRLGRVPVFSRIDRHGNLRIVDGRPLGMSGKAIAEIVKRRAVAAGLEDRSHPTRDGLFTEAGRSFGAHSLRAGFVTEGYQRKLSESEIAAVTGHTSRRTLRGYNRPEHALGLLAATAMLTTIDGQGEGASEPVSTVAVRRRRAPDWNLGADRSTTTSAGHGVHPDADAGGT